MSPEAKGTNRPSKSVEVEVGGRRLTLSNLDKVLYPDTGFTKAGVISYYVDVAPVMLAHLAGRPATLRRYPNGTGGESFFEKHAPAHRPEWVRTVTVPKKVPSSGGRSARQGEPGDSEITYVVISDVATLAWAANLAALEIHVPMWRVQDDRPGYGLVDTMVFDLDPGAPATIVECAQVALWVKERLVHEGLDARIKTSGSKGLQIYVPLDPPTPWEGVYERAHELAGELERDHPDQIVSNMRRALRENKVLIDWSQNHPAKTTVAPYSLRARPWPSVSTPLAWDEVHRCAEIGDGDMLSFGPEDVLARVADRGDLLARDGPAARSDAGE